MGMPITVTLSSVGVSRHVNLDWLGAKYISFAVTGSSSGTFNYTIEGTIDDIQLTPATGLAWFALSSGAHTTNSSLNLFTGSLGAIRVNSTALSSAILTMRILQGIGG